MPQPIGKTAARDRVLRIRSGPARSEAASPSTSKDASTSTATSNFAVPTRAQPRRVTEYVVDLRGTEYIDSAALGMLLVLRESAGSATVRITNSRPAVRKILQIANFNTLFSID